jgi:hypothetical protein
VACTANNQCVSGICTDGVCCESACGESCDVCAASLGATLDGICSPAQAGSPGSPACGTFTCDGTNAACPTTCTSASQCVAGNYCSQGQCSSEFECSATPLPNCFKTSKVHGSKLVIKHRTGSPLKDLLQWTWSIRTSTPPAIDHSTLGEPNSGTTAYAFCVYDGTTPTPSLISSLSLPPGGTCNAPPCWRDIPDRGFKFSDHAATQDGITLFVAKGGMRKSGRFKLKASNRFGTLNVLMTPDQPYALPVTAQLVNSDGWCWDAVYGVLVQQDSDAAGGKFVGLSSPP